MSEMCKAYYESEIGLLRIIGTIDGIMAVDFVGDDIPVQRDTPSCLKECVRQLDEYFKGKRTDFDLKIIPEGTQFQSKVWKALLDIPFGKTASYGEIAKAAGSDKAARAVGMANNRNKISVIIPCHRVIGSDGKLVGYGGGLWRKEWLLTHERKIAAGN